MKPTPENKAEVARDIAALREARSSNEVKRRELQREEENMERRLEQLFKQETQLWRDELCVMLPTPEDGVIDTQGAFLSPLRR